MMKKIVALVFVAQCAFAQPEMGVRAQSFGGAYRAVASSNDSIFYNPAGLIKNRRLGAEVDYMVRADIDRHLLGVSMLDSESSAWGAPAMARATPRRSRFAPPARPPPRRSAPSAW